MARACTKPFDETLLSGFLDEVITARERQIVRAHLVACAECRRLLEELRAIRQACLATRFCSPPFRHRRPRGPAAGRL